MLPMQLPNQISTASALSAPVSHIAPTSLESNSEVWLVLIMKVALTAPATNELLT